jgi:hypothetical protein
MRPDPSCAAHNSQPEQLPDADYRQRRYDLRAHRRHCSFRSEAQRLIRGSSHDQGSQEPRAPNGQLRRTAGGARRQSIVQEAHDINRAITDLIPFIKTLLVQTETLRRDRFYQQEHSKEFKAFAAEREVRSVSHKSPGNPRFIPQLIGSSGGIFVQLRLGNRI